MDDFKTWFKARRKSMHMTQEEFGRHIGISTMSVRRYESGLREPDVDTYMKISKALYVPLYFFLGEEGNEIDYRENLKKSESIIKLYISRNLSKSPAEQRVYELIEACGAEFPAEHDRLVYLMDMIDALNELNEDGRDLVLQVARDLKRKLNYRRPDDENTQES